MEETPVITQPVTEASPPVIEAVPPIEPSQRRFNLKKWQIFAIAIILILAVSGTAFGIYSSKKSNLNSQSNPKSATHTNTDISPTATSVISTDKIDWLQEPKIATGLDFMNLVDSYAPFTTTYCSDLSKCETPSEFITPYAPNTTYYQVGTMKNPYPGAPIYMAFIKNMPRGTTFKGIDTKDSIVYDNNYAILFVKDGNSYILPKDAIGSTSKTIPSNVVYSDKIQFGTSPYEKTLPNGGKVRYDYQTSTYDYLSDGIKLTHPVDFFTPGNLTKVHDFKDGHVLYSDQDAAQDSTTVQQMFFPNLNLRLPANLWSEANLYQALISKKQTSDNPFSNASMITWNKGSEPPDVNPPLLNEYMLNKDTVKGYSTGLDACFRFAKDTFTNALQEKLSFSDLTPVGKTDNGGTLYDVNNKNLAFYKTLLNYQFDPASNPIPAPTLEQYISYKPFLIYKDAAGVYEAVFRQDTLPQQCFGEPVIYLYPTKTTQVSVSLSSKISLSESAPTYKNGWNVVANPNGIIKDTKTNTLYNHLYWEGNVAGNMVPVSDEVVEENSIHAYLEKSLKTLGLNSREIKDFENYWEPRLKTADYLQIVFYDANELNKNIPLTVSPKPETTIRVLMDYAPASSELKSKKPLKNYKTPERNGFTLVEWGGILK